MFHSMKNSFLTTYGQIDGTTRGNNVRVKNKLAMPMRKKY